MNSGSASARAQAQRSVSSRTEMVDWSAGTSHSASASTSVSVDGLCIAGAGRCDLGDSRGDDAGDLYHDGADADEGAEEHGKEQRASTGRRTTSPATLCDARMYFIFALPSSATAAKKCMFRPIASTTSTCNPKSKPRTGTATSEPKARALVRWTLSPRRVRVLSARSHPHMVLQAPWAIVEGGAASEAPRSVCGERSRGRNWDRKQ